MNDRRPAGGVVPGVASIVQHPDFARLRPFIRVIPTGKDGSVLHPRNRIELSSEAPPEVRKLALSIRIPCVCCGRIIAPFRRRKAPNDRAPTPAIYFAAACPLRLRVGCSRGRAASEEYARVEGACA